MIVLTEAQNLARDCYSLVYLTFHNRVHFQQNGASQLIKDSLQWKGKLHVVFAERPYLPEDLNCLET